MKSDQILRAYVYGGDGESLRDAWCSRGRAHKYDLKCESFTDAKGVEKMKTIWKFYNGEKLEAIFTEITNI